jgi:hypothetical protein
MERQNGTGRKGQAEQAQQYRTGRREQAELNRQN